MGHKDRDIHNFIEPNCNLNNFAKQRIYVLVLKGRWREEKRVKMAPKQPDWTFLESLTPDDLEEDDTEKVKIAATMLTSISTISNITCISICIIMMTSTSRCTSSSPPGILVTRLTSEQLLPSCLSRSVSTVFHCFQLLRPRHRHRLLGLGCKKLRKAKY